MKIRFLAPARGELEEAVRYYDTQRVGLGEEFQDEAWEAIQRIARFPDAWHPLSSSIRRCQMNRFPYGLVYASPESEILVIAVAHLHQAPEYWRLRINEE